MLCHQVETCAGEIVRDGAAEHRQTIHSVSDLMRLLETVSTAMMKAGHPDKDLFRVRLALEEAVVNANKHGHQGDWSQPIIVSYHVSAGGVTAEVEDQGPGFNLAQVPDPLAPENLEKSSGRGLFLMRNYMTNVCHNEWGNRICLCKHRLANERGPSP